MKNTEDVTASTPVSGSAIPALEITMTPGVPPKHELCGWEELNRWANHNHALWRAVTERTAWAGMSEVEILKVLAAELLRQNVESNKRLWDLAAIHGPKVFSPNATSVTMADECPRLGP